MSWPLPSWAICGAAAFEDVCKLQLMQEVAGRLLTGVGRGEHVTLVCRHVVLIGGLLSKCCSLPVKLYTD